MPKGYFGILIILAALILGFVIFNKDSLNTPIRKVACTEDAKICSDGSYVGRIPPNCEFAACPISKNVVSCSGKLTPSLTEGPYYKVGSRRTNDITYYSVGERIRISGFVFDTSCKPIANAWLDFWQADGEGNYDNKGYKFRGHQYTDKEGRFELMTVIPGQYSSRTPHIHVKVRANDRSPIITSQLFMPNEELNKKDTIFNQNLVMEVKVNPRGGKEATFNFVVPTN